MSKKKSISLSEDEVMLLLNCLDTSIIYLYNCKSRFKLLELNSYFNSIDSGINRILKLSDKFSNLYNKFNIPYNENNDLIDDFIKLLNS